MVLGCHRVVLMNPLVYNIYGRCNVTRIYPIKSILSKQKAPGVQSGPFALRMWANATRTSIGIAAECKAVPAREGERCRRLLWLSRWMLSLLVATFISITLGILLEKRITRSAPLEEAGAKQDEHTSTLEAHEGKEVQP